MPCARGDSARRCSTAASSGREASWAGAGLIPPIADATRRTRGDANPLVALRSWSARLYPDWSAALREETGIDTGYRRTGGVDVAWTDREDERAAGRRRPVAGRGDRLRADGARRLRAGRAGAQPRAAVGVLPARPRPGPQPAAPPGLDAGRGPARARLEPYQGVEGFDIDGGRIAAVRTSAGEIPCGLVVVAAGAWSGRLLEPAGVRAPTPPLKGQIVLLKADRPLLRPRRRARQELPGPARRRPDPGRRHRGRRRLRRAADGAGRPRPARRGPAPLPDPGPRRRRGDLGRPAAREHRHPPLHRDGSRPREPDRRHRPQARRLAARAGHRRARRRPGAGTTAAPGSDSVPAGSHA